MIRLVSLTESDWLHWLADRMPCPICDHPMQQVTTRRDGYTDTRWACKIATCQFNLQWSYA